MEELAPWRFQKIITVDPWILNGQKMEMMLYIVQVHQNSSKQPEKFELENYVLESN